MSTRIWLLGACLFGCSARTEVPPETLAEAPTDEDLDGLEALVEGKEAAANAWRAQAASGDEVTRAKALLAEAEAELARARLEEAEAEAAGFEGGKVERRRQEAVEKVTAAERLVEDLED